MKFQATFVIVSLAATAAVASKQCYGMDGSMSNFQPCNPNQEHSACCGLTVTDSPDICFDTGLCLSTYGGDAGLTWIDGCTDPTGAADACPKQCAKILPGYAHYVVLPCGTGVFCCLAVGGSGSCCGNSSVVFETSHIGNLILPNATQTVTLSLSGTASPTACPSQSSGAGGTAATCPADKSAVVGGSLGAALVVALLGIVTLVTKRKSKPPKSGGTVPELHPNPNVRYRSNNISELD